MRFFRTFSQELSGTANPLVSEDDLNPALGQELPAETIAKVRRVDQPAQSKTWDEPLAARNQGRGR
jgi:hypothetical protein